MAVSAVFVLDGKGKLLISRDYRGDLPVACVERFVNILTGECTLPMPPMADRLPQTLTRRRS